MAILKKLDSFSCSFLLFTLCFTGRTYFMQTKIFNAGEIIIGENSDPSNMYMIQSGRVKVYKTVNEEKVELATMGKNDFFGEISLLLGRPHTATIEAIEDATEILIFSKEALLKKMASDPNLALRMITVMANRLTEAHGVITRLEGEKRSVEIMYQNR